MNNGNQAHLCECFTRDGLQHEPAFIPTAIKSSLIQRFAAAGFTRIEATSYSNPKVVPQFADASELLTELPKRDGVSYVAICANPRAVERALADQTKGHCVTELNLLVSASEAHTKTNLNRTRAEQWDNVTQMCEMAKGHFRLMGTISVAFGCPFEGYVDPDLVLSDVIRFAGLGVDFVELGDTTGLAAPRTVKNLFSRIRKEVPGVIPIAHFHDTRGTGLANALAAYEAGVRYFDSCFGGAGGHPANIQYGEGYTGNVCTEDLVNLFESEGIPTGILLSDLIEIARYCETILGRELNGRVTRSSLSPFTR